MRTWLLVLMIAATCLGCSAPAPAAPDPAPTGIALPPRPRDIPIDDVDPCSLLSEAQRSALSLDGEPGRFTNSTQLLGPTTSCTTLGFGTPNISVGIALAPTVGIETYTQRELLTDVSPLDVEGFPAVLADPQSFSDFCTVALDIAPGQLVDVQFSDGGGNQPPVSKADLCDGARRTATEVMRTLLAR